MWTSEIRFTIKFRAEWFCYSSFAHSVERKKNRITKYKKKNVINSFAVFSLDFSSQNELKKEKRKEKLKKKENMERTVKKSANGKVKRKFHCFYDILSVFLIYVEMSL